MILSSVSTIAYKIFGEQETVTGPAPKAPKARLITDAPSNCFYVTDTEKREFYTTDIEELYSELHLDPNILEWIPFGSENEYIVYNPFNTNKKQYNNDASFQTQLDIYGPAIITTLHPDLLDDEEEELNTPTKTYRTKEKEKEMKKEKVPIKRRKSRRVQARKKTRQK